MIIYIHTHTAIEAERIRDCDRDRGEFMIAIPPQIRSKFQCRIMIVSVVEFTTNRDRPRHRKIFACRSRVGTIKTIFSSGTTQYFNPWQVKIDQILSYGWTPNGLMSTKHLAYKKTKWSKSIRHMAIRKV